MRARPALLALGTLLVLEVLVLAPVAPLGPVRPAHAGETDGTGPLAGTLYAPARRFVEAYCAGCHWEGGQNPKKKRALPAMRLDSYQGWSTHQSVLKGVLDRWHPDGKVMPPRSAHAQPSDAERRIILEWLARGSPNTVDGK
jgi:hypothetical protein